MRSSIVSLWWTCIPMWSSILSLYWTCIPMRSAVVSVVELLPHAVSSCVSVVDLHPQSAVVSVVDLHTHAVSSCVWTCPGMRSWVMFVVDLGSGVGAQSPGELFRRTTSGCSIALIWNLRLSLLSLCLSSLYFLTKVQNWFYYMCVYRLGYYDLWKMWTVRTWPRMLELSLVLQTGPQLSFWFYAESTFRNLLGLCEFDGESVESVSTILKWV